MNDVSKATNCLFLEKLSSLLLTFYEAIVFLLGPAALGLAESLGGSRLSRFRGARSLIGFRYFLLRLSIRK